VGWRDSVLSRTVHILKVDTLEAHTGMRKEEEVGYLYIYLASPVRPGHDGRKNGGNGLVISAKRAGRRLGRKKKSVGSGGRALGDSFSVED